jgi:hypothetical protein
MPMTLTTITSKHNNPGLALMIALVIPILPAPMWLSTNQEDRHA